MTPFLPGHPAGPARPGGPGEAASPAGPASRANEAAAHPDATRDTGSATRDTGSATRDTGGATRDTGGAMGPPRSPQAPGPGPPGPGDSGARPAAGAAARARKLRPGAALAVATAVLAAALLTGISIGPAGLSPAIIAQALLTKLPWHPALAIPPVDTAIIWQIRMPRVVLGALVGAMLAGGGAAYQGVFRNPLADPYLLGVAAGGGLGATAVIVSGGGLALLPAAAFAGALAAVALTYLLGSGAGRRGGTGGHGGESATASIVLAGVAVAALLTAVQTYLQQQHVQSLATVYSWILGSLATASWADVTLVLPYVTISAVVLFAHRRLLDLLRVGETEASSLGVDIARLRLTVVLAATLGTAAAVAVSGLIGFVGIIVPHTVRLTAGAGYRTVLPVSMVAGAAFLVLADVAARTVQAPAEVPIGVITAFAGAPFFLFVLRSRRARQDLA